MAGRQRYDGDLEQGVRKFAVLMTWCSVFFRVLVLIVFWKASVDFNRIIKNHDQGHLLTRDRRYTSSAHPAQYGGGGTNQPHYVRSSPRSGLNSNERLSRPDYR